MIRESEPSELDATMERVFNHQMSAHSRMRLSCIHTMADPIVQAPIERHHDMDGSHNVYEDGATSLNRTPNAGVSPSYPSPHHS
mgnify:CR=1 FL=1